MSNVDTGAATSAVDVRTAGKLDESAEDEDVIDVVETTDGNVSAFGG
jgi:hypothetical protein